MSPAPTPNRFLGHVLLTLSLVLGVTGLYGLLLAVPMLMAPTQAARSALLLGLGTGYSLAWAPALWLFVAAWRIRRLGRASRLVTALTCVVAVGMGLPSLLMAVIYGATQTWSGLTAAMVAVPTLHGGSLVGLGVLAVALLMRWHNAVRAQEDAA